MQRGNPVCRSLHLPFVCVLMPSAGGETGHFDKSLCKRGCRALRSVFHDYVTDRDEFHLGSRGLKHFQCLADVP